MRRVRWLSVAAVVLVLGYVVADVADVAPGLLTLDPATTGPAPTRPAPSDPPRGPLTPAMPALSTDAPVPTPEGVAQVLDPLLSVRPARPADLGDRAGRGHR